MRVAYVLKRFPRTSETFIAQEILGLERHGIEVVVLALRATDSEVTHRWLSEIAAPVYTFAGEGFSEAWRGLQRRARREPEFRSSAHTAVLSAFDHPKRSGKRYLEEACWVESLCRELEIDHIHAHFANHPAFVALLAHQLSGLSFSFTAHAKDIYKDGPSPELWRRQVDEAAFMVTVSRSNHRHLESILGPELISKVEVLYNGVDLNRIQVADRNSAREGKTVLLVGRLIEKKGADLLIEAVPQVVADHPEVRFVLAGDGERSAALESRVHELGVGDRVLFTGSVPHEQIVEWMSRSAVFALPCRVAVDGDRDALPTVLIESMATGLPCISTPVNGVPEIVAHGVTGLIVPENDVDSLAGAISEILGDADLQTTMSTAGRQRVEQRFNLSASTQSLSALFSKACESTSEAASPAATVTSTGGSSLCV